MAPFVGRRGHEYTAHELKILSTFHSKVDSIDLDGAMDAFAILDADGSGQIEFHEMVRRFRAPEVVAFVEASKNKTLRQLLREDERRLERCFRALDADGSGSIERSEWEAYVTAMARERVRYLKTVGLVERRCYWGRRFDGERRTCLERAYRALLCCWPLLLCARPPKGFVEDLAYFTEQNHPLLAVFRRDLDHPYSRREQVVALVVLNAWALFFSVLLAKGERADATPVEGALVSLVAITMPVLVLDSVLFYLLACPCVRFERRGRRREGCFACCEWVATCLGHVLAAPLLLLAGVLLWLSCEALARGRYGDDDDNAIRSDPVIQSFVVGIVGSYALWPVKTLFKEFSLQWEGRSACFHCAVGCCGAARLLGFGQWARERSRALAAALADEEAGLKAPTPVI